MSVKFVLLRVIKHKFVSLGPKLGAFSILGFMGGVGASRGPEEQFSQSIMGLLSHYLG
jgi:hypothetical protein